MPNGDIVFMVQVNQWLTWLETAEEEESEGEDYWGTGQSHVLSGCNEWFFFFSSFFTLIFPVFKMPFLNWIPSLLLFINIFQPLLQFIPLWNVLPDQASITILLYLCFSFWFSILFDVLHQMFYTFQSSWVMFSLTVGSIVQETVPAPNLTHFITFYIW